MGVFKLTVINAAPPGRTLINVDPSLLVPIITGVGPDSFECGLCGHLLLKDIEPGQVQNLIIKCPQCEALNDVPAADQPN